MFNHFCTSGIREAIYNKSPFTLHYIRLAYSTLLQTTGAQSALQCTALFKHWHVMHLSVHLAYGARTTLLTVSKHWHMLTGIQRFPSRANPSLQPQAVKETRSAIQKVFCHSYNFKCNTHCLFYISN